jgi:hypothetical protein
VPRQARKPGAQPGNKNAEKHGYYSAAVAPILRRHYERAIDMADWESLRHEIDLARAQLARLLAREPNNHDILVRLVNTIARTLALNFRLSRNEEHELGTALSDMLAELMPDREV